VAEANILVVEDDPRVIVFIVDQLEFLGYRVTTARNGMEALDIVQKGNPDLIVLDVMMPAMDGYELCHLLKSRSETSHIPILLLTAKGQLRDKIKGFDMGADEYLPKPYSKTEFEARVRALLRRSISPPYAAPQGDCTLAILCKPGQQTSIRVTGIADFGATTKGTLSLDADLYTRRGDEIPRLDWRYESQHWGKQLHQLLFVNHPTLLSTYIQALGEIGDERKIHLRLESSDDLLRVPFEFLYDGTSPDGDYLALRHPLSRRISGLHARRQRLAADFLNELWRQGEPLRILLVASNTLPCIPGVDQEIESLGGTLQSLFEEGGMGTQVTILPTAEATSEVARRELAGCHYHIVHYAGHGHYDRDSAERSSLFFWEKPHRKGKVEPLRASQLQILLRGSALRFLYLSCCSGTATGEPAQLLDDDFLGIADASVFAGVPSVLGFRWPVSDSGAEALALAFYRSLAQQGELDTALLEARREVAARDRDDITWLSPVLIL